MSRAWRGVLVSSREACLWHQNDGTELMRQAFNRNGIVVPLELREMFAGFDKLGAAMAEADRLRRRTAGQGSDQGSGQVGQDAGTGSRIVPPCISTSEAAQRLGCDPRTVRRRVLSGELAATRVGRAGAWRILESSVTQLLEDSDGDDLP